MFRFRLLLTNEFKLFRTAIPIHIVAVLQPTVMYLLMSVILVHPTFEMNVTQPSTPEGESLVAAMYQVGSPIGFPYIRPVLQTSGDAWLSSQLVTVRQGTGGTIVVQEYGLIDSNLVKNYRNRLTAAALRVWNARLGQQAVTVSENPWLSRDQAYSIYFGMALLPMTVYLAASVLGAILTAQEFELGTILEYRLAPLHAASILGARLIRLVLTSYLAAGVLLVSIGLVNGAWPQSLIRTALVLLPMALVAGCVGMTAGLVLQKSIPSFLIALVSTFLFWLLGSAFGLAAGFGAGYRLVSSFTPNTHAVELLFPAFYNAPAGSPPVSILVLAAWSAAAMVLVWAVYSRTVTRQG